MSERPVPAQHVVLGAEIVERLFVFAHGCLRSSNNDFAESLLKPRGYSQSLSMCHPYQFVPGNSDSDEKRRHLLRVHESLTSFALYYFNSREHRKRQHWGC